MGCAFLFPQAGVTLPSLWEAINGRERDIPGHHHDHALGLAWNWKDTLPARKAVWYGKLLKGKPTFVSLDLLPAFYALSSNFGELDDYLEQYADGRMSEEARTVYEALLESGAQFDQRAAQGDEHDGQGRCGAALRAGDCRVAGRPEDRQVRRRPRITAGSTAMSTTRCLRWHPAVAEQARALTGRQAMTQILTRYLRRWSRPRRPAWPALFGWEPGVTARLLAQLSGAGDAAGGPVCNAVPAALPRPRRQQEAHHARGRNLADAAATLG